MNKQKIINQVKCKLAKKQEVTTLKDILKLAGESITINKGNDVTKYIAEKLIEYLSKAGANDIAFGDITVHMKPSSKKKTVELMFPNKTPPDYILKYIDKETKSEPEEAHYHDVPYDKMVKWVLEEGLPEILKMKAAA